jgi:hypothetical protein
MRILIYKRTHIGDPDKKRQFGIHGCMGHIRGFEFDAIIGVGGQGTLPAKQGIAGRINWVGRHPKRSPNPVDTRGPLVSFSPNNFRLFEQHGPFLSEVAPLLEKKVYGNRGRFFFRSFNPQEQKKAQELVSRIIDLCEFDHLQIKTPASKRFCGEYQKKPPKRKRPKLKKRIKPTLSKK